MPYEAAHKKIDGVLLLWHPDPLPPVAVVRDESTTRLLRRRALNDPHHRGNRLLGSNPPPEGRLILHELLPHCIHGFLLMRSDYHRNVSAIPSQHERIGQEIGQCTYVPSAEKY